MTGSQQALLNALKRHGRTTVPRLASVVGLNVETVREHLRVLTDRGLVKRAGLMRSGPGRPQISFALTDGAAVFFPNREGEVLRDLAAYLVRHDQEGLLRDFFVSYMAGQRTAAMSRVSQLDGRERFNEVVRIFSELGFVPTVEEVEGGRTTRLRFCHCPLRDLVRATGIPCQEEMGFLSELLAERLTRVDYIPGGDMSCSYERREA